MATYAANGTFAAFGGGIEPGESLTEAAEREFMEESGFAITDVEPLPVPPLEAFWEKKGRDGFEGSRTYYLVGRLGPKVNDAHETTHANLGLFTIDAAIALASLTVEHPILKKANARRVQVLQYLKLLLLLK